MVNECLNYINHVLNLNLINVVEICMILSRRKFANVNFIVKSETSKNILDFSLQAQRLTSKISSEN